MKKIELIELINHLDDDTEILFELPLNTTKSKLLQFVTIDGLQEVEDDDGNIYNTFFTDYKISNNKSNDN